MSIRNSDPGLYLIYKVCSGVENLIKIDENTIYRARKSAPNPNKKLIGKTI